MDLKISIPLGIGDLIYVKAQLDACRSKYDSIELCPAFHLIEHWRDNQQDYRDFVRKAMRLLFSGEPYKIVEDQPYPFMDLGAQGIWTACGIEPQRPRLAKYLCAGTPLELKKYYVMTTKIREMPRRIYEQIKPDLFAKLKQLLGEDNQLVILGEREIGMNAEYRTHGDQMIYSIYEDLLELPNAVDMTVPELGLTTPDISQFRQDCLIMERAERVIMLGVGGNFCMATAVGEVIGYRTDEYVVANHLYDDKVYDGTIITKKYKEFSKALSDLS